MTSFKNFLAESKAIEKTVLSEAVEGINENSVGYIIPYAMYMVAQAHIWHLLCPSCQKHMALGEFYDELESEVDELAERFIAQGGELQPFNMAFDMEYSDQKVYAACETFRQAISDCVAQTESPALRSIQDGVVDLQEVVDNKMYKFQRN